MEQFKKSKTTVESNVNVWIKNLPARTLKCERKNNVAIVEKSLKDLVKLPLNKDIIGRFEFLYEFKKNDN
jgi:hypothetical protein